MTAFVIQHVHSFHELVTTPLTRGTNALCWERSLRGDFGEVVEQLGVGEGITALDDECLGELAVSAHGRAAIDVLLEDQRLLREHGLAPSLECVLGYTRDGGGAVVRADVYSFHVDRAPVAVDTYLCTYHGPASEGLRNDEARRHIDVPATRAALLDHYGGPDDDAFEDYLIEHFYDLHYAPLPHARPFSFGRGNLWRIAVDYPGSPVPPCIHRAPETAPDDPPRLLLIS